MGARSAGHPGGRSSASRWLGDQVRERALAAEHEQMLGLAVLLVVAEGGLPLLLGGLLGVLAERERTRVGGRGVARERERLAHPAVVEVDEGGELDERALPSMRLRRRRVVGSARASCARRTEFDCARPITADSNGRSGPRGGQREQPHPRAEPIPRPDARVGDLADRVGVDAGDGPGERPAVGQSHPHVERVRRTDAVLRGLGRDLLDDRSDLVEHRDREHRRWQHPARQLRFDALVELSAGEHALEQSLPDAPFAETAELDRQRILDLVERLADADPESSAQERARRVLDEPHEVLELDQLAVERRQRAVEERRRASASPRQRARAAERDAVEAPRAVGRERARGEVARIERLQRVADEHLLARRPPVIVGSERAVDDVEQLGDGHRRRAGQVRALVVAGVGDDQPLGRGEQRVEQHLPVLGARVAVAEVGIVEQQVVAVARRLARELPVVEAEDAHDAVRHRPHRHERADREVPGAEVRARRTAAQAVGEQRSDVGELELCGRLRRLARSASSVRRVGEDVVEDSLELRALPRVAVGRGRQRVGGSREVCGPAADRLRPAEGVDDVVKALDELRHAAREVDRPALDVVERQHAADEAPVLLGHRDAEQDPIETGPPRVRLDDVELVRLAVRVVETPPDSARDDPLLHPRDVVVVEPEAAPDGLAVGEVEQLRGGHPLVGELEQERDDAEDGVRLPQRAVGEADRRSGRRLSAARLAPLAPAVVAVVGFPAARSERGLDQRGDRLDVGAHHDHVARLERRVLLEQVEDRVADDLDLAGAAVAGVHLEAAVTAVEQRPPVRARRAVADPAGVRSSRMSACSRPSSVSRLVGVAMVVVLVRALRRRRTSCSSRESWPHEASSRLRGVVAVRSSLRRALAGPRSCWSAAHSAGEGCSTNTWTSRACCDRREDLQVARRQPRDPEQREALREDRGSRVLCGCARRRAGGARRGSASRSGRAAAATARPARRPVSGSGPAAPVAVLAARPGLEHLGAADRVAVVEVGDVPDAREPPAAAGRASPARPATARRRESSTVWRSRQTSRSAAHGSLSGSMPVAVAVAAAISVPGNGKSMFAQTPSRAVLTSRRARSTAAGSASAPCRGSGPRSPRARTGPRADRAARRAARRRGRRRALLGGCAASRLTIGPPAMVGRSEHYSRNRL